MQIPDQNLAEMVGVDPESAGKKTIAELLSETFITTGGTTIGIPPSTRIENRIWQEGLYEGTQFDLLSVGTKWIEGCYCMPDAALKNALSAITRQYQVHPDRLTWRARAPEPEDCKRR